MKKLALALALGLLSSTALAGNPYTAIGNANYTALNTDSIIVPTVAITANRTITLPYAAATCVGAYSSYYNQGSCSNTLQIVDSQGVVGGSNSCLVVTAQSGDVLNGTSGGSTTFCSTNGRVVMRPMGGNYWQADVYGPGQLQATATNDNAQAGFVGEVQSSGLCQGTADTATVTITIASPGVVTWTAHGFTGACPIQLTTTGALPTGYSASTTYWAVPSSITTNTFTLATSLANALAGTAINTSGTQSGTQTGTAGQPLTTATIANLTAVSLTAGDWDCRATVSRVLGASTSVTKLQTSIDPTTVTLNTQGQDTTSFLQTAANVMGALGQDQHIGPARFSLASTTTEYLTVEDTFTVSTDAAFGSLTCRRVR